MENPFSSRFIMPENCDFVPIKSATIDSFEASALPGISQIVGPHGCGKSTLACQLSQLWIDNGVVDSSRNIVIRNGRVFQQSINLGCATKKELVVVDGVENISWLNRRLFIGAARRRELTLLFTTHCALKGVPVLFRLLPDEQHFIKIVDQLQRKSQPQLDEQTVQASFHSSGGNYRTALMQLYDEWQLKILGSKQR